MHSTKPIHTCSDVRMRPAFITLAGCIDGRPNGRNERRTWTWRRRRLTIESWGEKGDLHHQAHSTEDLRAA